MKQPKLSQDVLTLLSPLRLTVDKETVQQQYGADPEGREYSEQRELAQDHIEVLRKEYELSENPLFV